MSLFQQGAPVAERQNRAWRRTGHHPINIKKRKKTKSEDNAFEIMNENYESPEGNLRPDAADWKKIVAKYQKSSTPKATWQIVNTLGPYALLWYLMYHALVVSWWITAPLAILAGAFLVRVFIIFHDCGHGSF